MLMYPSSLMEIYQPFHSPHGTIQFYHIIFQLPSFADATTAIINVSLSVIIHKYTRINHRVHSFNISLHFKSFCGFIAGSHTNLPAVIPIRFTGMREIKIVGTISVSTIRGPHETSFFPSPRHLLRTQDFSMIRPIDHVIGGEHMIPVHQVASTRRSNIMRSIHIQSAIFPDMC